MKFHDFIEFHEIRFRHRPDSPFLPSLPEEAFKAKICTLHLLLLLRDLKLFTTSESSFYQDYHIFRGTESLLNFDEGQ
jgi:hypothetical protein